MKRRRFYLQLFVFITISAFSFSRHNSAVVSAFSNFKVIPRHEFHRPETYMDNSKTFRLDDRMRSRLSPSRCIRNSSTRLKSTVSIPSAWYCLGLLAIQFGCQPLLTKKFTPKSIIRSTVVLAQDAMKIILCFSMLILTGAWSDSVGKWTLQRALLGAGIPSALYLVQNYCSLIAYQNLPPVTYNILNQTKTLSAALCCYFVLGRMQSPLQIASLFLLLLSALVLEKVVPISTLSFQGKTTIEKKKEESSTYKPPNISMGVIPILVASFISGLAGAISQQNLQISKVNPYVFSMELSAFSIILLLTSLLGSPDGKRLRNGNLSEGWTWKTWIPVVTNAAGGILVGLVTKHAGAVKKGFALIFGLILSGALQSFFFSDEGLSQEQIIGVLLASLSLWMHSAFPP